MPERQQDFLAASEISLTLQKWREEIIRSVLTGGLKPGSVLNFKGEKCLLADDDLPSSEVCGCSISWVSLAEVLYWNAYSILPVISERLGLKSWYIAGRWQSLSEEEISNIEKRFTSAFLVVCDENRIPLEEDSALISPENFLCVIFPRVIYDPLSPDTKAIIAESGADIEVVRGFIKREIPDSSIFPNYSPPDPPKFIVPNYEKALRRMRRESEVGLWVHGVRLPTEEDVERSRVTAVI